MTLTRHHLIAAVVVVIVVVTSAQAQPETNQTDLRATSTARSTVRPPLGMRRRQGAQRSPVAPSSLSEFKNASKSVRNSPVGDDDNIRYDLTDTGSLYEPDSMPDNAADTHFTIQNVFSGEYLYVDDSRGIDDSVVQTGSVETIQAKQSRHALFRLEWNEDLYVRIICVDNEVMLTGTLAPHVENHPVAPVIGSRIRSAAALWSLGEISWAPEAGETMFIINHKYTDFLFAIGDPSKKKPALTTRHVKLYGLARSRWIVRPFHDEVAVKIGGSKGGGGHGDIRLGDGLG